ncbi:MAG: hypothetical protein CM15mP49_21320 [Actinomycetota bacterium]|nr:MAG: hypothetical protein CM15mP49_21320 [Actinomycetota bacterium]
MVQSNSSEEMSKGDEYLLNLFLTDEGIADPAIWYKSSEMNHQYFEVPQERSSFRVMRIAEWFFVITG